MKDAQRTGMRALPDDRKQFLVLQHRQTQVRQPEPLRSVKTGPEVDAGVLGNVKRFSLASVGWGAVSPPDPSPPPLRRPTTTFELSNPTSPTPDSLPSRPSSPPLQSQATGTSSSWTSWWTTASNATGSGQATSEQAKDSPQFYVDQLRSTCV